MRKARVFGTGLGVQNMGIEDLRIETGPDGGQDAMVVSVRTDARATGRCPSCPSVSGVWPGRRGVAVAHGGHRDDADVPA